jgi:hypothetical protein
VAYRSLQWQKSYTIPFPKAMKKLWAYGNYTNHNNLCLEHQGLIDMTASLESMCLTWRHDYGLLPPDEQKKVRDTLEQLYYHHVRPLDNRLSVATALVKVCKKNKMQIPITAFKELVPLLNKWEALIPVNESYHD